MKRALILFFLAPAIGELLSGSSPPAEFFNPLTLLTLCALYGSGAILARELRVRWGQGWPSLLVLGAAYGVVEEGLMVKSFFDPNWMDLGVLGVYGRWAGVNWIWSLELTLYHAVFSITIPVLLVELLAGRRDEPWIGRRGMLGLSFLLLADVAIGFLWLTTYRPPLGPYLVAVVAAAALGLVARKWPARRGRIASKSRYAPRPLRLAVLGFVGAVAFFACSWVLPSLGVPVWMTALGIVAVAALLAWRVNHLSGRVGWSDEHKLALAGGLLGFFVLLGPLQELDTTRPDNTAGLALVALAMALLLLALWWQVRRRARAAAPAPEIVAGQH